jgi:TRAP transporter TAXI family solute receptor
MKRRSNDREQQTASSGRVLPLEASSSVAWLAALFEALKQALNREDAMSAMIRRTSLTVALAAAAVAMWAPPSADAQQRKSLRWTTAQVGTYGYQIAAATAKILEQALGGEYTVVVQPFKSPIVSMKAVMNGDGEIAYTADIGMGQLSKRVGPFKDYKPAKPELVHTWYAYPMESMMATTAKHAPNLKCWKDFSGKPVFFTTAGFQNWLNWQRIFKALGYDFKHVEIDLKSNADALEAGTIVGSGTYTTAGKSVSSYWKETEIRTDVRVINPCPDEVAKLKAAGLAVVEVDPKAFTKNVGPAKLMGVPILFGYNLRADAPTDLVYKMVKGFYDRRAELAKIDPGFGPLSRDFVGMQVTGINANPEVPVHPGLAKFLKEQKAWNDKWKVAPGS